MKRTDFIYKGLDEKEIHAIKWEPECESKAVIQIAHGMAETAIRYERFARRLSENGYTVYINNHRGHGDNEETPETLGYLADKDGFDFLVSDMKILTDIIKKDNEDIPLFAFGHSMGSFALQKYLIDYPGNLNGAVLCGSNGDFGFILKASKPVISLVELIKGQKSKSKFINNLMFGMNNNAYDNKRTDFDWLSRDEKEVDKYIADEKCGFVCTVEFYRDFIKGLEYVENRENLKKLCVNHPLLIVSGDMDPIGKNGKGVKNLYERYKKYGINDIEIKLFEDARHEILNEINREEVMDYLISWFDEKLRKIKNI